MGYNGDKKLTRSAARRDGRTSGSDVRSDEFINLELDSVQAAECKVFRKDVDAINLVLTEMLEDGYKLTMRHDDRNECLAAFAFAQDDHDNAGYILTGRGGSGLSALSELLYKHSQVMDRNWPAFSSRNRKRYADDD